MSRSGYSLIELVVALIAASVLVSTLAGTVVITTELLDVPPDDQLQWHDRGIADRLAADLRYATQIDEEVVDGFQITKPDPGDPASVQTVTYEASMDGLTRQLDAGPLVEFDSESPNHLFQVDGYSAPTATDSGKTVRLRSSSTASSTTWVPSLDIDLPPGCKDGDLLLLCISAKEPMSITLSDGGWDAISTQSISYLRLANFYRTYRVSTPSTITINVSSYSAISAAMLALENVDGSSPISWLDTASGYAQWDDLGTHPSPLETTGFLPGQMNVQVFAGSGDPWSSGTLGIASFTDAARETAAKDDNLARNSIGIAIRNGPTPSLATTPRLWCQSSGYWLQTGIRLEVAQ